MATLVRKGPINTSEINIKVIFCPYLVELPHSWDLDHNFSPSFFPSFLCSWIENPKLFAVLIDLPYTLEKNQGMHVEAKIFGLKILRLPPVSTLSPSLTVQKVSLDKLENTNICRLKIRLFLSSLLWSEAWKSETSSSVNLLAISSVPSFNKHSQSFLRNRTRKRMSL